MTTATSPEKQLLNIYLPIRDQVVRADREWIDNTLLSGSDAEIDDAIQYCKGRIDEIQRTHAVKEA